MDTQRFLVVLATDGDVREHEIGEVLDALGYRGLLVLDLAHTDHEHPCPSSWCIAQLREQGHVIDADADCCICWARLAGVEAAALTWHGADTGYVTDDDDQIIMARLAYSAYGQTTDFKNYLGKPMPKWEDLGDTIQSAWVAAANAVNTYLTGPPATDE